MEQEKAIAVLDLFATSRTGIDVAADQIIHGVKVSGEINSLKAAAWCKTMEEIIKRVRTEIADNMLRESDKYPEKTFDFAGATFTKAEHGVKYNYAACGDTEWERLDADTKTAAAKQKVREEFLKALKKPMTVIDEMTGEVVTIQPPIKTGTGGLNISIK